MAVGDVTSSGYKNAIQLLAAATATNSPPSGASAGVAVNQAVLDGGAPRDGTIFVASTAGSGTMTVTLRLWSYLTAAAVWAPCGTGSTASLRGVLNGGVAIDEIAADTIAHHEVVGVPWAFDRLYLEITAIGGTATAISAWLVLPTTPND